MAKGSPVFQGFPTTHRPSHSLGLLWLPQETARALPLPRPCFFSPFSPTPRLLICTCALALFLEGKANNHDQRLSESSGPLGHGAKGFAQGPSQSEAGARAP